VRLGPYPDNGWLDPLRLFENKDYRPRRVMRHKATFRKALGSPQFGNNVLEIY
jgi:hypothetical protein